MPSCVDYLLRKTFNWYHRSALQKLAYLELYKLINDGKEPLQLVSLSATRWLARGASVKRILEQWCSLKTHFQMASSTCDKYAAGELAGMYRDPSNELYLTFLKPILCDFERVNLFQQESADQAVFFMSLKTSLC